MSKYPLQFPEEDWEEIESLFPYNGDRLKTRQEWIVVAMMALGKAQMIREGRYDGEDDDRWANQLTAIADKILDTFRPGDGKL